MSTSPVKITLEIAFKSLPKEFRSKMIPAYRGLKSSYIEGKHDVCGVRSGRLAEIILRFLQFTLTGNYIPFGQKINNFTDECNKLGKLPNTSGVESFRILIPRALNFVYTLRNKRGIGHVGGDIDANPIDAATCVRVSDWCLAELMRVVHTLSLEEAQELLNSITLKQLPYVWEVMGRRRVLEKDLDYAQQTLLLLYSSSESALPVEDLYDWVEHPRLPNFRSDVLGRLHSNRFIEYDKESQMIMISPKGILRVEKEILPKLQIKSV